MGFSSLTLPINKHHYFAMLNQLLRNNRNLSKNLRKFCFKLKMSTFDEKSGIVPCETEFGRWWQTLEEVFIEINSADSPISSKEIKLEITNKEIKCDIKGKSILQGKLFGTVSADESFWTLEEKKIIKILLAKASIDAANCWASLFKDGRFAADLWTADEMQKKLTLQRLQTENPGFDFSSAEISGNYAKGGPRMPV